MKRLLANILMVVGGFTASSQLLALGLGELTLQSALNQPLQAEITLVDTRGLSEWEIKPALATQADFDRAGVDRVFFLTRITFKVDGDRILLTSREPVNEPYLNFLVELNWPSGRVLREYTVLLDPPVFQEQAFQPLVSTPASAASQPAQSQVTETVTVSAAAAPVMVNRWDSEPAPAGTYKVQQNDTLWDIALQTRPSSAVSPQQMMIALQQENPGAFIGGNINRLKSHQVLRIPDEQTIRSITMGQAIAEVARQNQVLKTGVAQVDATGRGGQSAAGRGDKQGGEVRLLSAGSDDAESAGAAGEVAQGLGAGRQQALENDLSIALENVDKGRRENEELRKRLESLEEQINTLQRLISLKDDQLAGMQVSAAELASAEAAVAETTPQAAVDFNYSAEPAEADEPVAVEDDAAAEAAAAEAAAEKARRERIAAMLAEQEKQQRPQPGVADMLLANPAIPAAGFAILALIGLLILRALKKRKEAAEQAAEAEAADLSAFDDVGADVNSSLDDFDFDDDELRSPVSAVAADEHHDEHHDEHFEAVAQTGDAISESDIYIAYGKFEQAVDILQTAIEHEPSRTDLRLKLLEVYVEMDDAKAFAAAESELASLGDRGAVEEAKQMRNRLSSPLAVTGAVSAAAALSLDDDIPELDTGLGDEFADGLDFGDALDMASDSADVVVLKQDKAPAVSALDDVPALDLDDSLDFDLGGDDEPVLVQDDEPEVKFEHDDALDFDLGDFDAPVAATEKPAPVVAAADDSLLDFDLGELVEEAPAADELSELVIDPDADDGLAFDLEDSVTAEADSMETLESLLDGDTTGSDELPDLSFDMEQDTGFAESADDDLQALENELAGGADDLDADLSALAEETIQDEDSAADIAVSVGAAGDAGEIDLDQLAAADDEFDFLAGTDECATKLDLARAYIDMEDFDGARELLQEVTQEGSDQQKSDARSLLSNLA